MRWLLDTNLFIETAAGRPHAIAAFRRATEIEWAGFSAISLVEALGFPGLSAVEENNLKTLFGQFVEVSVSAQVIEKAIHLRRAVRIDTPDALIAATALVWRAELITRNVSDFSRLPGLTVIDPAGL